MVNLQSMSCLGADPCRGRQQKEDEWRDLADFRILPAQNVSKHAGPRNSSGRNFVPNVYLACMTVHRISNGCEGGISRGEKMLREVRFSIFPSKAPRQSFYTSTRSN